jgi:hypothetical protein
MERSRDDRWQIRIKISHLSPIGYHLFQRFLHKNYFLIAISFNPGGETLSDQCKAGNFDPLLFLNSLTVSQKLRGIAHFAYFAGKLPVKIAVLSHLLYNRMFT